MHRGALLLALLQARFSFVITTAPESSLSKYKSAQDALLSHISGHVVLLMFV